MMVVREVNILKLKEYIKCSWEGDVNLPLFYDRSLKEKTLDNMVRNTHDKIMELADEHHGLRLFGVDFDDKMVGFIVLNDKYNYLYSFGVKHDFRKGDVLKPIFFYISSKMKNSFSCLMNECNHRAIRWLKKCGMIEIPQLKPQKDIVYLKYDLCPFKPHK
jgi:hypothetical protein